MWQFAVGTSRVAVTGGRGMTINVLSLPAERRRASARIVAMLAIAVVTPRTSIAAEQAAGVLLYEQGSAGVFHYNIDVKDSGTTSVGTVWYSWIPGEDFLGIRPTNLVAPPGWTVQVTNLGTSDGFAVQWINNNGPLMPGKTLSGFAFDTTQTPAELAGSSPVFSSAALSTTFIYSGAPFSDAGFELNINPTAHPWQNPFAALDINNDGLVSPADVALEVSALVSSGIRTLGVPTVGDTLPRFVDTNGDGLLSPVDLLGIINQLAVQFPSASALGVTAHPSLIDVGAVATVPEPSSAALLLLGSAILAFAWQRRKRRVDKLFRGVLGA
jgi:hypothetical protein